MDKVQALFEAAVAARGHAYAPYSGFAVGAALVTPKGAIFSGANVEKRGLSPRHLCRGGGLAAMIASGERQIAEMLVLGDGPALVTPCGACRQRIREFACGDAKIHAAGPDGVRTTFTLAALLPEAFGPDNLKRN